MFNTCIVRVTDLKRIIHNKEYVKENGNLMKKKKKGWILVLIGMKSLNWILIKCYDLVMLSFKSSSYFKEK